MRKYCVIFIKNLIEFVVNGELLTIPEWGEGTSHNFRVYAGKSKKPIGFGFITKKILDQNWFEKLTGKKAKENFLPPGLSVSTYGKIIKSGWEWVGIMPKNYINLGGAVEIPALAQILTTNKNDFLSDAASLKIYYKIRKNIQQAILPILKNIGEYGEAAPLKPEGNIKPLARQIEYALSDMTDEFPELSSLLGVRRGGSSRVSSEEKLLSAFKVITLPAEEAVIKEKQQSQKRKKQPIGQRPGLEVVLEDIKDAPDSLGRIIGSTIFINTCHPAWAKALKYNQQEYHVLLTVGLILSEFLDPDRHPQKFLSRLLAAWGKLEKNEMTRRLL